MLNKQFLVMALAAALLAIPASQIVFGGGNKELICHITDGIDPETGCTIAVVIEVAGGAIDTHKNHGDPPAPAGTSPGDIILVDCP